MILENKHWSCVYYLNGEEYNICLFGTRQQAEKVCNQFGFIIEGELVHSEFIQDSTAEIMFKIFGGKK